MQWLLYIKPVGQISPATYFFVIVSLNTEVTFIYLCEVQGCFCATKANLSSSDNYCVSLKPKKVTFWPLIIRAC